MNKKILIGLSALGMTVGFWACGDGSVEAKIDIDNYAMATIVPMEGDSSNMDLLNQLKNQAISDCEADSVPGGCRDKMNGKKDEAVEPTDQPTDDNAGNNSTDTTPSQTGPVTPTPSGNTTTSSASTNPTPTSSAAAATDPSVPDGTCSANVASVQEGAGTVTWTFTPSVLKGTNPETGKAYSTAEMLSYKSFVEGSTCNWTIEGATPSTASGKCGSDAKAVSVTYATGGKSYSASIKLGETTITCGSVRVNGKPITGCSCKSAGDVDIATNPNGSWTVSCTGSNDPITGYKWDGATAASSGTTATYKFTKAKQEVSPKVTVSTAKTDTTLTCPAPKVTDSNNPETNIDFSTAEPVEIAVGNTYTVKKCNTTTDNIKCDSNGGGHKLLVNGTAAWTSYDWMTGSGQYQAATKCSVGMTLEATGGNITCVNNW